MVRWVITADVVKTRLKWLREHRTDFGCDLNSGDNFPHVWWSYFFLLTWCVKVMGCKECLGTFTLPLLCPQSGHRKRGSIQRFPGVLVCTEGLTGIARSNMLWRNKESTSTEGLRQHQRLKRFSDTQLCPDYQKIGHVWCAALCAVVAFVACGLI